MSLAKEPPDGERELIMLEELREGHYGYHTGYRRETVSDTEGQAGASPGRAL